MTVPNQKTTPLAIAGRYRAKRIRALAVRPTDGPIVALAKWFANCPLLHWPIEVCVSCCLGCRKNAKNDIPTARAERFFRSAVEWYWLSWMGVLVGCYIGLVSILNGRMSGCPLSLQLFIVWTGILFCAFRLIEILATSVRLHFVEPYSTNAPVHALMLTFLAFLQVAVAFSALYSACAYWFDDNFGACDGFAAGWIDPLYFSVVTLATVGYGDFSPRHLSGRLLVIIELFYGLLLVVVAFQRVIAATQPASKGSGKGTG